MPIRKSVENVCFLCQKACDNLCPHCEVVYFCSETHFNLHRISLKQDDEEQSIRKLCLPYKTENKPGIGRVLIATRTIKPMELILIDPGTCSGPNYTSKPVCLECLTPVKSDFLCSTCLYPMCGPDCCSGPYHSKECEIISRCRPPDRPKNLRIDMDNFDVETNTYAIIMPLRMLLMMEDNKDTWSRSNQLMDHVEERKEIKDDWNWYEKYIVSYFIDNLKLGNRFSPEQIHRAVGLINVNAVAMKFPHHTSQAVPEGKGLYPIFAIGSHYCVCNARYTLDPKTRFMYVRARAMIRLGEEISMQYLSALYGNFKRRKKIKEEWYFDCICRRCSDSTECGTNISAIMCPNCGTGSILPLSSLDYDSIWECVDCKHTMKAEAVEALVDGLEDELNHIGTSGEFGTYSEYIDRYGGTLVHKNHYLIMTAARNLIQWYTYKEGSLSTDFLRKKTDLCKQLDFILGKIDPGYSEIRSFVQKELHFGILILNQKDLEAGLVDRETYLDVTRISMKALDELERYKRTIKFNCIL